MTEPTDLAGDLLARVHVLDDERLRKLAVDCAAIDAETKTYHRKRDALEPWSSFDLPPSLRKAA